MFSIFGEKQVIFEGKSEICGNMSPKSTKYVRICKKIPKYVIFSKMAKICKKHIFYVFT